MLFKSLHDKGWSVIICIVKVKKMNILEQITLPEVWQDFLQYKIEKQHLTKQEKEQFADYIEGKKYLSILEDIKKDEYCPPVPEKKELNKGGVAKKRVVYSYPQDFNMLLKMIAFLLYDYDDKFSPNCYAFRRNYGVKDAILRIRTDSTISEQYCLKVDIRNYFNSIDTTLLLQKLKFLKEENENLYDLFKKMLQADIARIEGKEVQEYRGAMAGTPISPFFANVYFMNVDAYFEEKGISYFRYSDDILLFADTMEELKQFQQELYQQIKEHHLTINESKVHISKPGESWEFLGLAYENGRMDLSENTKRKIKKKIKRKAQALRRWQQKKGLQGEHAAKGFIKAMNHKFFAEDESKEFTWSRWFFPNLTTDKGLKEIDAYMQQYIRYCVTGRHNKGNYKVTYEQMKQWGYRNLVHEYYKRLEEIS